MGSFRFPFTPTSTASIMVDGVALPAAARYPMAALRMVGRAGGDGALFPPVTGSVRDLGAVTIGAASAHLIELSPIPFAIRAALQACRGGCPTFYLATTGTFVGAANETVVNVATPPVSIATPAASPACWVGVMLQDRLAIEPWAWLRALDDAMAAAGEPASDADRTAWSTLLAALPRALRLLEASGRPSMRALEARSGTGLWAAVPQTGNDYTLPTSPSAPIELRLAGAPATARPVFALHVVDPAAAVGSTTTATAAADPAPATFTLPAGTRAAVLQVLDLDDWFATRALPATPPFAGWTPLDRYHLGSRTEPVVDGNPGFARIADDLANAMHADGGAHFAGLTVKDFPLVEGNEDTRITRLSQALATASGTAPPYLIYKFANLTDAQWTALHDVIAQVGTLAGFALEGGSLYVMSTRDFFRSANAIASAIVAAVNLVIGLLAGAILSAIPPATLRSVVEGIVEASAEAAAHLAAIWSRYPADLADNPFGHAPGGTPTLPLDLQSEITHFGSWHQKLHLVRRHASGSDPTAQHVAWVGGLDIDPNRADDPGHRGKPFTEPGEVPDWSLHPWHDVHARVTGAAAADLWKTWNERYEHELVLAAAATPPVTLPPRAVNPPPEPAALALPDGPHAVQIGRTYYRPGPGHTGLPFAPAGETSTNDTLIKAIRAARDYIYIEDQYFTPPGEAGLPDTLFGALVAAGTPGPGDNPDKKLIIVTPSENDQPFGAIRRRFLFDALGTTWGTRVLIGTPMRPPLLPAPGIDASSGRVILLEDLGATATSAKLGPRSRLPPGAPYWLWIEGELMLCVAYNGTTTVDLDGTTIAGNLVTLRRAGATDEDGRTGASVRAHGKGAPVTLSQIKGIYVHAKVMIVDDVFVSIGTSNLNRRGMYHDGEVNAFTVPRTLLAPSDNPARALRLRLWAEHLGLPPEQGSALLGDVPAAFELWKRHPFGGNRFAPRDLFLARPAALSTASLTGGTSSALGIAMHTGAFAIGFGAAGLTQLALDELWRKVVDPTTDADPHPESTIIP